MVSHPQVCSKILALAWQQYRCCRLCEHRCGVDRLAGERGFCQAGPVPRVFRSALEYGEEAALVPSQVVYLSGCDLRCEFCITGVDAYEPRRGRELTPESFARILADARRRGARNLQWSGGEPSLFLPSLLQLMADSDTVMPVVWKSNFHETVEAMELLEGTVDVYLADFKFGNNACARRLGGVSGYMETLRRNLLLVGRGGGRLIVRHLLLPGHEQCCFRPIVRWLADHLPGVEFSIRDSYLPPDFPPRSAELRAVVAPAAAAAAVRWAHAAGLQVIQ